MGIKMYSVCLGIFFMLVLMNTWAIEEIYPCHLVCRSKRVMPFPNEKECNCGNILHGPRKPEIRLRRDLPCQNDVCKELCNAEGYVYGLCGSYISNKCTCLKRGYHV